MQHRGKWAICAVFAIGIAASLFAVWYLNQQSRRALAFWGPDAARLIIQATDVELLRLLPSSAAGDDGSTERSVEQIEIENKTYQVADRRNAVATRGFIHIRRGLMTDAAFDWPATTTSEPPQWEYALRFVEGRESAVLAFSFDPPCVTRAGGEGIASIAPVAQAMESFFREAFQSPEP